ncbi:hypothetical protein DPMN_169730 [Dreissena polymorpha]|uniref:Uncharacterized protein n=1 Tax=Dreissena polymorpha TaxID=45954 RepID=A0A9D4IAW9_DREPO|nr:hypothetical protein DPMN_169730 [Dreissena polymorpha]
MLSEIKDVANIERELSLTRRVKDDQNSKVDSSLSDTKLRSIKNGNPDTSSGLFADRRWVRLSSR